MRSFTQHCRYYLDYLMGYKIKGHSAILVAMMKSANQLSVRTFSFFQCSEYQPKRWAVGIPTDFSDNDNSRSIVTIFKFYWIWVRSLDECSGWIDNLTGQVLIYIIDAFVPEISLDKRLASKPPSIGTTLPKPKGWCSSWSVLRRWAPEKCIVSFVHQFLVKSLAFLSNIQWYWRIRISS